MAQLVKYMGGAHVRQIDKGETFDGRYPSGLESDLKWSRENNFVVDADALGLSKEAVELLLEDDAFKDVTNHKRIPSSEAEQRWYGHSATQDPEDVPAVQEATSSSAKSSKGSAEKSGKS